VGERRPNRAEGAIHDEFWEFCSRRQLRVQRCRECASYAWPPVDRCEYCGGSGFDWHLTAGTGKLQSWATFEQKYYDVLPIPWDTILVELDEGPLFVSNPVDFSPDEMVLDMPVQVDFLECEDDRGNFLLPVFRRSSA
jgi:uncharacterized protein